VSRGPTPKQQKGARELRESFDRLFSARDHAWLKDRETCRCTKPNPGTRYLGESRCVRCQYPMRS